MSAAVAIANYRSRRDSGDALDILRARIADAVREFERTQGVIVARSETYRKGADWAIELHTIHGACCEEKVFV